MPYRKKVFLYGGFFLLLLGSFLAAPYAAKGYLHYKVKKAGYTLSYAKIAFSWKNLNLAQVKLIPKTQKMQLEADSLLINWSFTKGIELALENPHFTFLEKGFSFSSKEKSSIKLAPFKGTFSLTDKEAKETYVEKGHLSFDGKRFYAGMLEEEEVSCNITSSNEILLEFSSVPLESWQNAFTFFVEKPIQIQGNLHGAISIKKDEKEAFVQFAKLSLKDFKGSFFDKGLTAKKGEVYVKSGKVPFSYFRSFLFSKVENLHASIFLEEVDCFSAEGSILTKANFKGSLEPFIGSKLYLSGITSEGEKLTIQGKAFFFSRDHNWLELTAKFLEGKQEKSLLLLGKEKKEEVIFQLNTRELESKQGQFLQKMGAFIFPDIESYEWKEGKISGQVEVCFTPNQKKAFIKEGYLENFSLAGPGIGITSVTSGSVQAEITLQDKTKIDYLKTSFENAKIDRNAFCLEKAKGLIHIENDVLLPTQITAFVNQLLINCEVKGKTSFLEMYLTSKGKSNLLFAQVPKLASEGEGFILESYVTLQSKLLSTFTKIDLMQKEVTSTVQVAWDLPFTEEKSSGWVLAENCEVKRFNSLWEGAAYLEGTGSFLLDYQDQKFYLRGTGENLVCKTDEIHLYLPKAHTPFSFWWGKGTGTYEHDLFLQDATLYVPMKDLTFTEVEGCIEKREETFFAFLEKVVSDGVGFKGEANFQKTQNDLFFEVFAKNIQGDLLSAQKFCSHFLPNAGDIPISEGIFIGTSLYTKGSMYQDTDVIWMLEGEIAKGKIDLLENRALENFSAKIKKNQEGKFWLSEVRASMNLGGEEPLFLFAPYVFWDKGFAKYDVRLENFLLEILRVNGSFSSSGKDYKVALFSDSSHFMGEKLEVESCEFGLDKILKNFQLKTQFDFGKLYYLSSIIKNDKFFPSQGEVWLEKLKGKVDLSLCLGEKNQFEAISNSISFGEVVQEPLQILAQKKEEKWEVSTFSLGGLKGDAHLDFSAKAKSFASFCLEEDQRFKLQGDLCYCEDGKISGNLSTLWFKTEAFPGFFHNVKGDMEATGCFLFDPKKEGGLQVDLDLNPQKIMWKHLTLYNENKACFHYTPKKGALVKGLNLKLFSPDVDLSSLYCKVGTLHLNKELFLEKAQVYLEGDLSSFIEKSFQASKKSLPFPAEWLKDKQKNLEWSGDIKLAFHVNSLSLNLSEAYLPIGSEVRRFQDLFLQYDANVCFFKGKYAEESTASTFEVRINFEPNLKGIVTLKEENREEPLLFSWSWEEGNIPRLHEVNGSFYGIEASLFEKNFTSEKSTLLGSIYCNFEQLKPWLPEKVQESLDNLSLGEGYELKGDFSYGKDGPSFQGILSGKEIELGGFQFKTLLAQMNWEKNLLQVKDLKLSDAAGTLKVDSLEMRNMALGHELSIPKVTLKEFRPCLMRKKGKKLEALTPFLIRSLVLTDIKGFVEDPASFTGVGKCYFINSFKREHTVFDIPSDVIGRIFGLDLELLIPVKGEVDIELKKGKFFLTSLQYAYSENHRSKFFFVEKDSLPYIDLNGDLYINVKMKQYVLFKFTENFIIKIRGKINDPSFSLNRKKSFFSS